MKSIVRVLAKHPTGVASGLLLGWMALVFAVLPLMHMHQTNTSLLPRQR
ncbi:MAG UNVERIFIED_CONTAM: hypothetical protein LVT10_26075 [Anaerolineae bacterium]